jgi:membrane associated rhomboid family serine protease
MVAVFAHLGGFAFGLAVAALLRMFGKPPPKKGE